MRTRTESPLYQEATLPIAPPIADGATTSFMSSGTAGGGNTSPPPLGSHEDLSFYWKGKNRWETPVRRGVNYRPLRYVRPRITPPRKSNHILGSIICLEKNAAHYDRAGQSHPHWNTLQRRLCNLTILIYRHMTN